MADSKWIRGKVRWFNDSSGRGEVWDENGNTYKLHYSAIETKKQSWKTLKENQKVKFKPIEDDECFVIEKVREE